MGRTAIIGGNWKMNLALDEAYTLASEVRNRLGTHRAAQVVVFPPFPYLEKVASRLRDSAVKVGAQDVHQAAKGAYTSGVSAKMLASVGCSHVLIGHSERRTHWGDSDSLVGDKLKAVLDAGLDPVLCVGETLAERQAGRAFDVIARQLDGALGRLEAASLARLVIAYEPVWAIGTGQTATPAQAQEVHKNLRGQLANRLGTGFAAAVRIQYGGSVTADNAASLLGQPDIDGALVGGASLDVGSFSRIVMAGSRR